MRRIEQSGASLVNDFEGWQDETIYLDESQIDRAIELSDPVKNEAQQWQAYLNAIALFAFEQWLQESASELEINPSKCSIFYPEYAGLIEAVCNLSVAGFKLCLIPIGANLNDSAMLPRAAVELPKYSAHFYVILLVIEELEQAIVHGFMRHDQLLQNLQANEIEAMSNWNYRIPLSWFEKNPENLLLSLRCLAPTPLPLETNLGENLTLLPKVKRKLQQHQTELTAGKQDWWEVFNWEEASVLFNQPEVFQTSEELSNSSVNVAVWLQDKLDLFAQELAWVLLPGFSQNQFRFAAVNGMRSPVEELDNILMQLERNGTQIPQGARGAYQDLTLSGTTLRLYVVTWSLLSPDNIPLWKLLLVLGVPDGRSLPDDTSLRVSDRTEILVERVRDQNRDEPYLYARVAGTWEDTFSVTISLRDGEAIDLPPFAFSP